MEVIGIVAVMRRVLGRVGVGPVLLGLTAALALSGCDGASQQPELTGPLGRMEFNLVGQGSQGTLFRLRDAVVTVQGADRTLFFDSEQDPDSTSLSAIVPAGSYTSFLQEGWRLERVEGGGKTVTGAALISPNPDFFDVFESERTRVALRFQVGADVVVTDPGLLEIVLEVEEAPAESTICSGDADCASGQVCCLAGFLGTCLSLDEDEACPLPDLTVSAEVALASLRINQEFFPADSCAIDEGCVVQPGTRRLLRFSTMTPNIGDIDLILGDPTTTGGFEFAECHGHFHFEGYAHYELVDATGRVVAEGHKQAFCLLDSVPVGVPGAPTTPRFHCGFQGLTRGWADIYDSSLDCQWVDITDVPDGEYLLRISINPDRVIAESRFDNNTVEVPVSVADPPPVDPLSACTSTERGPLRECGWAFSPGFEGASCSPGQFVTLGCGCNIPESCGGDPIIRVCEGTTPCGATETLALVDDACGFCPQVDFVCPGSGTFSLLVAPFGPGAPFICDIKPN